MAASLYSIVKADLVPGLMRDTEYTNLLGADAIADVITAAENDFNAAMGGGMFADAANIALAKPMVVACVLYWLHARRAQNGDYKVPDVVLKAYDRAIAWAETTGVALLAAEGTADPAAGPGFEATYPDATHDMDSLDNL